MKASFNTPEQQAKFYAELVRQGITFKAYAAGDDFGPFIVELTGGY